MSQNRIGVAFALMLLFAGGATAPAQSAPPAAAAPGVGGHMIAGVVLNARSGQPLHDAEVVLIRTAAHNQDRELTASTVTDAEGRFSFSGVPDGKFALHASHRGYIGSDYDEHETVSTAIVTGEDPATAALDITNLQFRLAPQAILYGTIAEDSGDPVPGAQIALYRQDLSRGTGSTVRASMTSADDQGNYEIANLAPGSYFLSVSGTPWYATQPQIVANGKASSQPRSPLDVAYPVTFYPDAIDAAFAAPIAVAPGDRVQINLTLHPMPSLHVTMQVPGGGPNRPISVPQLRQDIFGSTNYIQPRMSFETPEGRNGAEPTTTVELSGIPPGQYDLAISGPMGESARETTVNLASDQALDLSSATPLAEVSGKLVPPTPGKLPASLYLMLDPQEGENPVSGPLESDGTFHFRSVRPGTYEFVVGAGDYPMTVTHISATGATASGRLIKIGSEPVTLVATIAETTAILHGFARHGGKSAPGVFLLLVPANPNAGREAWRTNQSDSDGSFDFAQVMPGQYTLLAIQDGWGLDWAHPESIARYLPGGLKVTVPAHAGDIQLKDPVEVQQK